MRKLIIFLIFGMFLISLTSATVETLGASKQSECIRLIQSGAELTECNITSVNYPNSNEEAIGMVEMTSYNNKFNYTFCDTTRLGDYIVNGFCGNGTDYIYWAYDFEITADGFKSRVFPTQFVVLLLGFILIGVGFINDRLSLFKSVGSIITIIMGIITLYPGYSFINWTTLLGKTIGAVCIGVGAYFFIENSFSREEQSDFYDQYHDEEEDKLE